MALNAEKETQQDQNASGDYRVLLSGNANDNTEIAYINKNTNLRFNPGTQLLSVGGSISATGDLTITGNTNLNGETYAEGITAGSLLVNGNTNFVQIPTAPTPANDSNDTSVATTAFVMNAFTANDAMVFKGVVNANGDLPTTHKQGWTYRVATTGTYAGKVCEIGDMIICVTDGTAASNNHWTVVQTNIDGAVTGPATATAEAIAIFNGTTGKIIKNSAKTITTATPASNSTSATIPTSNAVWAAISGASGYGKTGTVTGVQVKATAPIVSSTSGNATTSLNTTISLAATSANYVIAGPTSGTTTAVPTYRKLVAADIPITVSNTWANGTTGGPTLSTTVNGITGTAVAIPAASETASGVITTGDQIFRGKKGFGDMERYGKNSAGTSIRYVNDTWLYNGAKTWVGEFWYDIGDATNITKGQYYFRQGSPNTTANTATTGFYETYTLPNVTSGLTANKNYDILTTKNTHAPSSVPTLSWNTESTVFTLNGSDIKIKMPANPNTDTKNTAGSTDTSSKIYLIGATSQAANPQTYSDNEVFATSGVLTAKTFNSTALTASQAVSTDANKNLVSTNLTVSDPTAGTSGQINFIATISQNAQGKITATKQPVRTATTAQTGVIQINAANANSFINQLSTGDSTPADNDYFISQYVNGGTTTTTYHRRKVSTIWDYVKGKMTAGTYWANIKISDAAKYNTAPEMATLKLNGNTSATAASTFNVTLVYDTTSQALNFVFA